MSEQPQQIELLQQQLEQLKRENQQLEQLQREKQRLEQLNRNTTLVEYLADCHLYLYKALLVAGKSMTSTTGLATRVNRRHYPMRLRPWDDFVNLQQCYFDKINKAFGDKRLLPPTFITNNPSLTSFLTIHTDTIIPHNIAIESPVLQIFVKLFDVDPAISQTLRLRLTNVNRELKQPNNIDQTGDSEQSQQVASDEEVQERTYPDGLGLRRSLGGEEDLAFVYDYKATYNLLVDDLKPALVKEKLFIEVVRRINENQTKADDVLNDRDDADEQVAIALAHVFDYMVHRGVKYGYAATGSSLIFLYIRLDDPRTLYYHLCAPDEDEVDILESHTAVAQLASFCLLALESEPLQGSALQDISKNLNRWPEPYEEAVEHIETENTDSSQSTLTLQKNITAPNPSIRSVSPDHQKRPSFSDSPPTRQYCTQACLLGLKREWDLDENCPNVSLHRTAASGTQQTKHPISTDTFACLVEERLRQNPYRDCVALDPYGLQGKIGAIGALFKVELAQYGYTFVGKGTQSVHLNRLQRESLVYSRLDRLQGEIVPVYLGIIDLPKPRGYVLPGGAQIVHMMLMSWAGEVAKDTEVPDLEAELKRSRRAVRHEGVDHGDLRVPNTLWNWERRRIMIIDFDRAVLRRAKHDRLTALNKADKKRKSKDIDEVSGQKSARIDKSEQVLNLNRAE
ncbi:hypothetical protein GGS24DRAFT_446576 [Hypoxylon argillaceum]|nr:hypothetical protein GGS24DRAFT_446576 [Hypoxylon argillaceum]